jgi:putative nucleotidyltransferase with HDIG domain
MRIDITFLRSRVARRIFTLFIICALIPITVLATLSFIHVTKNLNEQSQRRLHRASKAAGMTIYERLLFLKAEMKLVASNYSSSRDAVQTLNKGFVEYLKEHFEGLVIHTKSSSPLPLFGRINNPPALTTAEEKHLSSGKVLVASRYYPDISSQVFISMALDPQDLREGILLGEIRSSYLWGVGDTDTLPPMTELSVLDQSNNIIFSTLPGPVSFPEETVLRMGRSASGQFAWQQGDSGDYLASYWLLFLKNEFFTPKWTVVLSESKANVLAPMANFKKIFPLVALLSLWVVLLLSVIQIRKNLVPLEKLQEGTRRISNRDFKTKVNVTSGDEFEELAESFNTMASLLDRQFNAISTISEIDRTILSVLDTNKIVDTILTRMHDFFPCDSTSVALLDTDNKDIAQIYAVDATHKGKKQVKTVRLLPEEERKLCDNPRGFLVSEKEEIPAYLVPMVGHDIKSSFVIPILLKEGLSGIISLGFMGAPSYSEDDLSQAFQLVDQVAIALSNAHLLEELDKLNWGTLTALARAVDAKSPWTAGHSERVTEMALKIGRAFGLDQKELDDLHRGGLLHDIGKLATPADVLDKAGKLTEEDFKIIRKHPVDGARILEPIAAYSEILLMAVQHHEWFNGKGYPNGLTGEKITLGSRILAVADVYDALISDRPYRARMKLERVIDIIKGLNGTQFDPKVVEAFLEVMVIEKGERGSKDKEDYTHVSSVS